MPEDKKPEEAEPAAEPETASTKKEEAKEVKKVAKPDDALLKARLQEQDEKLGEKQDRLDEIKAIVENRQQPSENAEFTAARNKLTAVRAESRRLLQEKRSIYDQISAADELKKQQTDLTQRLKAELQFYSVEDIERKIKALEHQQQTTSTSVKEDKKIIEDIKRLSANKPMIKQFDEAQEALRGVKEHHNELYTQLKAKNAELGLSKDEEEKWRAQMDAAKAKEDEKKSDLPALFKERDELRKEINAIRDEVRKIRDEFNEQRKEFFAYSKALREQKQKEWEARNAARDAEREAWRKAKEEEEAKRDPWEEEKHLCEQLISYVEKYLPKKEAVVEAKKEVAAAEVPKGAKIVKRDDDDDYLAALRSKKGKKGGKGAGGAGGAPPKPKSVKLSHTVEALSSFAKLGFSAPPSTEECPGLYEELIAKREWFKTAPPKEKKKPAAPAAAAPAPAPADALKKDKDAPPTADTALEIEGMTSQADADKIEAAIKKLDGIISVSMDLGKKSAKMVGSPGFPTSDKMIEAVVAAGFKATEKRLAGGMFKFDPEEVDVNGGDATADDLMDAFGFGDMGEGGGDSEEEAAEEEVEAPAPAPAPAPVKKDKDAPPTADTALEIEGMTSQADADKIEAAIKKLDGIISVSMDLGKKSAKMVGSPGFPTSDKMIEAVVAAGFKATEKRLAGGMFKFDPEEVDVNGGDATADDLMDAFGFGDMGEGGGDSEEEAEEEAPAPAPAPAAAAAAPNGSSDLITIQATSETTVKVGLNLGGEAAPAAPPKKDKDAPPTADTALEIEGMETQADADKIEAAIKALDGIISVTMDLTKKSAKMVGSPGFPTSDKMIEAVVAVGFKATEKRLAGGMFKFDPDEVDVNGGDATADDLMEAFGF